MGSAQRGALTPHQALTGRLRELQGTEDVRLPVHKVIHYLSKCSENTWYTQVSTAAGTILPWHHCFGLLESGGLAGTMMALQCVPASATDAIR